MLPADRLASCSGSPLMLLGCLHAGFFFSLFFFQWVTAGLCPCRVRRTVRGGKRVTSSVTYRYRPVSLLLHWQSRLPVFLPPLFVIELPLSRWFQKERQWLRAATRSNHSALTWNAPSLDRGNEWATRTFQSLHISFAVLTSLESYPAVRVCSRCCYYYQVPGDLLLRRWHRFQCWALGILRVQWTITPTVK